MVDAFAIARRMEAEHAELFERFVRLGLSDDTSTEVRGGELKEGERLILRIDQRAASPRSFAGPGAG